MFFLFQHVVMESFIYLFIQIMQIEEKVQVCQLPKRPRGLHSAQRFQEMRIITNFYPVKADPIQQIHIFRLKFSPQITHDDRATRKQLLDSVMRDIRSKINEPVISGFNVYSTKAPLEKEFKVSTSTHQINIKEVKVINVNQNNNMLVVFLNNALRSLMTKLSYMQIGKTGKYFNSHKKDKIQNLIMYSGFKANFMMLEKGIFLRVDTAKKIVRNQTVLQFIDDVYRNNGDKGKQERREIVKQGLIGKIIMTNYGRPRYQKISDVEFSDVETTMIPQKNISIKQYYLDKYKIKIDNLRQPLLVIEDKKRKKDQDQDEEKKTYMIPELCLMTGIPDDFDEFKRKKISEATIRSAEDRKRDIGKLMDEIKDNSEIDYLKQIGLRISPEMETIKAKLIPAPKIRLGSDQRIDSGKESFFNLFAQPIYASKHNLKVGLIHFRSTNVSELIDIFENTAKRLEVDFKTTTISAGEFDSRKGMQAIDDCINKACDKECNILLIVIPVSFKTNYKKIKEKCLYNNQVVCQVVTQATLRKNGIKSIATKILLQLIAKRGNTLWVPESTLKLSGVMLAAFDTAKIGKTNMMSGVATINSTYSSIFSQISEYSDNNDKLGCMTTTMLKLVDAYFKRNKEIPKEIVMFANSCSNDQMNLYHDFMINPLITKLQEIYGSNKPNLTVTMINTKTNERFFHSQGNGVRNVPAGTIISENVVTKNYDFFMVSQYSTKGSTVPNHYKVIYTNSKMEEGVLQELIYSQCFNYVNWTGSIKVPGILQYAKKCVKFNTEVLEAKKLCEELESKLYFI